MFVLIHHDPQQYHRSGNKMHASFINTEHITALHLNECSINMVNGGNYIHIDGKDFYRVLKIMGLTKENNDAQS